LDNSIFITKPQKKIKMSSTTPTQNFKIGEWQTTPTQNFKIGEWQTTGKPVRNKTTIWQKIVKKIKNIWRKKEKN